MVAVATAGPLRVRGQWAELVLTGRSLLDRALAVWQRWDALWYQRIAQQGYRADDGSTAFFPLYPLAARALAWVLGGRIVIAELLLSSAAFVVAMVLLHRLVRLECARGAIGPSTRRAAPRGRRPPPAEAPTTEPGAIADASVWALALFPVAFFFHAPYTESVFLALTIAALLCAREGRAWTAGALALLAATARTQGALLALPLGWELARERRRAGRPIAPALIASLLPVLGALLVGVYFRRVVGVHGSALETQGLWGYALTPPWESLLDSVYHITSGGDPARGSMPWVEAINLTCLLGFTMLAIAGLRRLPATYSLYTLPSLAILYLRDMSFSPLMSVSRFTLVLFPCFMLAAPWLARRRAVAVAWLALAGLAQSALFAYWTRWGFVA